MLTFIIIIILISFLIRLLIPYVLPRLLGYWVRRQYKARQEWQGNAKKPEGTVDIKFKPPDPEQKRNRFPGAEYVDFEEIKEPEKQ